MGDRCGDSMSEGVHYRLYQLHVSMYACTCVVRYVCTCVRHAGRQAYTCERACVWACGRATCRHGGACVRQTGRQVGMQACRKSQKISDNLPKWSPPMTISRRFLSRARTWHGYIIQYPRSCSYVGLCWFMLNLCWFEVPQTPVIPHFMLVCYNFLYFSRKKK